MNRKQNRKPAENDNNWLGIMGVTNAALYNRNSKLVGYCMDTPNAIAQVLRNHPEVQLVKDAFGGCKNRSEYSARMAWAKVSNDGYRVA